MSKNNQNMPEFALKYMRTTEDSCDIFLSLRREDMVFFADGACHILAHMFFSLDPKDGFDLIYTKPVDKQPGKHTYESNGT